MPIKESVLNNIRMTTTTTTSYNNSTLGYRYRGGNYSIIRCRCRHRHCCCCCCRLIIPNNNNNNNNNLFWYIGIITMISTMIMILMMITNIEATEQQQRKKYFLMGLPKSGSYYIHEFIHCMNQEQQKLQQQQVERDLQSNQKQQHQQVVLSSAHYCCYPNRTTTTTSTMNIDSLETTSYFPCPTPMIPCGTCFHNYYQQKQQQEEESNEQQMSNNKKKKTKKWYNEPCGNYDVYTNYHVEVSGDTSKNDQFTYFLPQHYTLPYLIVDDDDDNDNDDVSSNAVNEEGLDDTEKNDTNTVVPTTIWILNQRSTPELWANHIHHWYSITNRIFHSFQNNTTISYYSNDDTSTIPLSNNDKNNNQVVEITTEYLQDELDISFERMNNHTDYLRRIYELQTIYTYHSTKVQHFVTQYNNDNKMKKNKNQIQLHIVNIDTEYMEPDGIYNNNNVNEQQRISIIAKQLGQIFGYYHDHDDINNNHNHKMIQSCWKYNMTQYDMDYLNLNITTGFRASA